MNKKLRALLDSINAKKQEVQDLAEAGKLTEAQTAKTNCSSCSRNSICWLM